MQFVKRSDNTDVRFEEYPEGFMEPVKLVETCVALAFDEFGKKHGPELIGLMNEAGIWDDIAMIAKILVNDMVLEDETQDQCVGILGDILLSVLEDVCISALARLLRDRKTDGKDDV